MTDPSSTAPAAGATAPQEAGIRFTETMRGYFAKGVTDGDYQLAFESGRSASSPFEFTLTISGALGSLLDTPGHGGTMEGTATAPALSPQPMTVKGGVFQLFVEDPESVDTRLMKYTMTLEAADGSSYAFSGFKRVGDRPIYDVWHDTTTLYITVHSGGTADSPILGQGILHISAEDFAHQLTTFQVEGEPDLGGKLKALGRFGRYFAGTLFDTYGGIFSPQTIHDPDVPARQKRPLRVGPAERHPFRTTDGVDLLLTRYKGGDKGPVILSHGLGVSSLIFSIDTIETNLLEFLYARGYDVWLLDFRDSIALPASAQQSTGDDVATKDYPSAVETVRAATGRDSVQMVVHCWGSTTFFMAMTAGLQGVRSVVSSQIATSVVAPLATRLKTGLHLPTFLKELKIDSLTAYVDTHADWMNRLYDDALKLYPVGERCRNPVCHRITFMYAPFYQHAQLNELTHESGLHEMFGIANMRSFEHLATITNTGHIVNFQGGEAYMPHLDRLALPITFIHGEKNECFLPESTAIAVQLLAERNGAGLYERHVVPGYGHSDCIFGKNAAQDIYPLMLAQLEATL